MGMMSSDINLDGLPLRIRQVPTERISENQASWDESGPKRMLYFII